MYKDDYTQAGHDYVRHPGQVLAVKPVPVARSKEDSPHNHLRLGILPAYAGHHPASDIRPNNVDHLAPLGKSWRHNRIDLPSHKLGATLVGEALGDFPNSHALFFRRDTPRY